MRKQRNFSYFALSNDSLDLPGIKLLQMIVQNNYVVAKNVETMKSQYWRSSSSLCTLRSAVLTTAGALQVTSAAQHQNNTALGQPSELISECR